MMNKNRVKTKKFLKGGFERTLSMPWFKAMIGLLYCGILVWYVLIGLYAFTECSLVYVNTIQVEGNINKEMVFNVTPSKDVYVGNIMTESGTIYEDKEITGYTRIKNGLDPYYMLDDGTFASPLTNGDIWAVALPFMLIAFIFNQFTVHMLRQYKDFLAARVMFNIVMMLNVVAVLLFVPVLNTLHVKNYMNWLFAVMLFVLVPVPNFWIWSNIKVKRK